jgi:transposase
MEIPKGHIHIIHTKPNRGTKTYYYARKTARVNGKPKVVWSFPLGTVENIIKQYTNRILDHIEFQPFSFGLPAAFLAVAEQTKFFEIVNQIAPKKMVNGALTTGQYLLIMMMGRALGPFSKAKTGRQFSDTFLNLFWNPAHHMNTQNLVNHMDKCTVDAVEKITDRFGATLVSQGLKPSSVVFWDHTNHSTCIENWGEKNLPYPGYAKDKRFDKNLIGTSIVLSKDEIPLYHTVYPGNENDVHLFSRCVDDVIRKINRLWRMPTEKITLVFDKGNNSQDNLEDVLRQCHIVGSLSFDEVPGLIDVPLAEYRFLSQTSTGTSMQAYRTSRPLWDLGEFTLVATYNPQTAKRQKRTWEKNREIINKKLTELQKKFLRTGGRGRRMTVKGLTTAITQTIPKQYRGVYWWDITGEPRTFTWKLLTENEEQMMQRFGKQIIFTDLSKWDTLRIVQSYHRKYKVEKAFHWLHDKLLIPIPPFYHNKDDRIRVHIFICIMALSFIRLIKRKTKRISGVSDERLLDELRELQVALVKDVRTQEVQLKVMAMTPVQAAVFSQLQLDRYIKAI